MIDTQNILFPLTVEAFTAMQRAEMGREPSRSERELFSEIVDMANSAYVAGCIGDHNTIVGMIEIVNASFGTDPAGQHPAALCRGWILLGFRRGLEMLDSTCNPTS